MRLGGAGVGAEAGQATPEWVGLVLVVALALGAVAALRPAAGDRRLGDAVAERISCAARGSCAAGREAALAPASVPGVAAPGAAAPGAPSAGRRGGDALGAPGRARVVDALRRLRVAGGALARRAWIVCLGYRRFRYELEHPRLPSEAMPLAEALDIANGCLNPYAFLAEE
jgi:hypothetical protein